MTSHDDETDDDKAIAHYRRELQGEAEIARGDLDEIEDHLRSLAGELRDTGVPRAQAIAEACRRLGEPRHLAREHARVRSRFGAKLSRMRAWSAAAVLVAMLIVRVAAILSYGTLTPFAVGLVVHVALLVALVLRVSWARPLIVGSLLTTCVRLIVWSSIYPPSPSDVPWLLGIAGALAFVIPWRRGEIAPAGWALVLLVPAVNAASSALMFEKYVSYGVVTQDPFGTVAFMAVIAAGAGIVMRARWASVAAAITALALIPTASDFLTDTTVHTADRAIMLGVLVVGCVAAGIISVLAWRTARSTFGTLRGALS